VSDLSVKISAFQTAYGADVKALSLQSAQIALLGLTARGSETVLTKKINDYWLAGQMLVAIQQASNTQPDEVKISQIDFWHQRLNLN